MKLPVGSLLLALCFVAGDAAQACSAFLIQGEGLVLAGNNEDYWDPDTKVWFVPGDGKTYGRVCFGFGNGFPQGGLNERGLFFDGFATAQLPAPEPTDKPSYPGSLIDVALAECATVAEVIALLERYNLAFLDSAMLLFGDRTGDAVIVERDTFVRKQGRFQVVTNFHQSQCDPSEYTCPRYRLAEGERGGLGRALPPHPGRGPRRGRGPDPVLHGLRPDPRDRAPLSLPQLRERGGHRSC